MEAIQKDVIIQLSTTVKAERRAGLSYKKEWSARREILKRTL